MEKQIPSNEPVSGLVRTHDELDREIIRESTAKFVAKKEEAASILEEHVVSSTSETTMEDSRIYTIPDNFILAEE